MRNLPLAIIGVFSLGFVLAGCGPASLTPAAPPPTSTFSASMTSTPVTAFTPLPASPPTGTEINFQAPDQEEFSGTLYGQGPIAIILANMSIGGEKQWDPLVAAVDKQKFTTLTFNYPNIEAVDQAMDLVLGRLREQGFEGVICIGASLGTRACSSIAREPEIVGLVLIAGSVHHASVAEAAYPKLFISGALDRWAFDIQTGYEQAAEPRKLILFEDNRAHGTDLFRSEDGGQLLTLLIDFVNSRANP